MFVAANKAHHSLPSVAGTPTALRSSPVCFALEQEVALISKTWKILSLFIILSTMSCGTLKVGGMEFKPEEHFNYRDGLHLNYRLIGEGKRKIIFLHGFAASNRTWDYLLPLLELNDSQLVLFDLIGSGFSSKPKTGDYSILENAKAISKFISENNYKEFVLVGHSFGGGVALLTTIELQKENIDPKALVLIDAAAYKTELPFFVDNLRTPILSSLLLFITSSDYQARYTLEKIYFDKRKVTKDKVHRYSFFMALDGHGNAMIQTAKQIVPSNFNKYVERYDSIGVPTLILWGSHDLAIPKENGVKLSEQLPNAKLLIIEKSGHNPQEEQPIAVAREISQFLGRLCGE